MHTGVLPAQSSEEDELTKEHLSSRAHDRLSPTDFVCPPLHSRPGSFWDWLNGSITKDQITRDLEAMKQAGMRGGVMLGLSCWEGCHVGTPIILERKIGTSPHWQISHRTPALRSLRASVNFPRKDAKFAKEPPATCVLSHSWLHGQYGEGFCNPFHNPSLPKAQFSECRVLRKGVGNALLHIGNTDKPENRNDFSQQK